MKLKILQIILLTAAFGWGINIVSPWYPASVRAFTILCGRDLFLATGTGIWLLRYEAKNTSTEQGGPLIRLLRRRS